jgi:hypothetical protein
MELAMREYAKDRDGILIGREKGEEARLDIERAIRAQSIDAPIALDFHDVRSVSVPFADALLVPLISNRMIGYYGEHPIVAINMTDDVADTLGATLERRGLFLLGAPPPHLRLLGAQETLEETLQLAHKLSPFSVLDLARALDISQQATNNRLKLLLNSGALVRKRVAPARGGKEFVYEVPATRRKRPPTRRRKQARSKVA